jgi:glutamate-ammonia-ligase adenylyltransferase
MASLSEQDVEALLRRPGGRRSAMVLAGCGFAVPRRAAAALREILGASSEPLRLFRKLPTLLDEVSATADPDAALEALARLAAATGDRQELLLRLADDREGRRALLALLGSSRAFASALAVHPSWLENVLGVVGVARVASCRELRARLRGMLSATRDRAGRLAVLRRFRRRETLVIAARDFCGRADLDAVTAGISAVAEATVAEALEIARAETGCTASRLAVLALGKLGGAELNYSSDIDLIFVSAGPDRRESELAEELLRQLSEPAEEGVAYRVDMRLRPEGSAGTLVWELEPALAYYRERARPWERQALIKCRPIAGDPETGCRFMVGVEDFVWRPGLTTAQVARACQLRSEMERAAGSGRDGVEVKSGPGGIRDVEFAVQILQLAHGAAHPQVRHGGTLTALAALEECGLIDPPRARSLRSGYEFLRRVEHCLQTMDELALHEVPADPLARAALARRLGYGGSPESARREFEENLDGHSTELRRIYDEICGQGASGRDLAARIMDLLEDDRESELVSLLSLLGFGGGRRAAELVRSLARRGGAGPELTARILEHLRKGPAPDRGLASLEALAGTEVLQRLDAEPRLLESVLAVAQRSGFVIRLLAARHDCLELLLPGAQNLAPDTSQELTAQIENRIASAAGDELTRRIAASRERELIRAAARDLIRMDPPEQVSAQLCCAAEAVIRGCLRACAVPADVAVLALGRLGGRELSYGSDLDLVFVDTGAGRDTSQQVQRATRALSEAGYEVDTRLRPGGASGPLVASLTAYGSYRDRGELAVWERLALARARTVAGSDSARSAAEAFLEETLFGGELPANLAAQTWNMRLRLESTAGDDDFKRGPGGLVDLEFLAEYLALAHGRDHPELRVQGTAAVFSAARSKGVLPSAEAGKAIAAHRFLCRLEMRASVMAGRPVRSLPSDADDLGVLSLTMELDPSAASSPVERLRDRFATHTAAARRLLERVLGR